MEEKVLEEHQMHSGQSGSAEDNVSKHSSRDGWKFVIAAFFLKFFQGGLLYSMGMLVPAIVTHFKTGRTEAGMVISLLLLFNAGGAPIAALLIRKCGHTVVTALGLVFSMAGFILAGLSVEHLSSLAALYIAIGGLAGFGFSCLAVVSVDGICAYHTRNLGLAIGIGMSGSGVGQLALSPLLQIAIENVGLAKTLVLLGASMSFCFISVFLIYKESSRNSKEVVIVKSKSLMKIYKEIFFSAAIIIFLGYSVLVSFSVDAGLTFNADRAIFLGINAMDTTYLMGIMGATNTLGKVIIGKIVDRFSSQIFLMTTFVMVAHALLMALSDFLSDFLGQAIFFALFGLTCGSFYSTSAVLIKKLGDDNATECTGLWILSLGLASVGGPAIVGPLFDAFGGYRLGYVSVGLLGILGVLLLQVANILHTRNKRVSMSDDNHPLKAIVFTVVTPLSVM